MTPRVAIIGGGVSGLTCAVSFAERGFRTAIFAEQIGQQTTSGAAAALWFPYDAEPIAKVIPWALATYKMLADLVKDPRSGVSMAPLSFRPTSLSCRVKSRHLLLFLSLHSLPASPLTSL